jgi:primosomal protein N'
MAHAPELLELYVCENCHGVYAGTVSSGTLERHQYEPPTECSACGNTEFVESGAYPHLG